MRGLLLDDVRILAYHRVLESNEPDDFSFDLDLVSASADAFRAQMRYVRDAFQPMRFGELADCLDRGQRPPKRALLVSFDDGYEDNHRIAFPILRELGMSAMFFVSTDHIASGLPYAYDWFVHMLCIAPAGRLQLPELGIDEPLPASLDQRRALAKRLLDRMKTLDALAQQALIRRLEGEWHLPRSDAPQGCRPMTWDAVREMHAGGMEIGSHGRSHHMLSKLPPRQMRDEIFGSKHALEHELGAPIDTLSYPVGGRDAYDSTVIGLAREAGYRLACSYVAGTDPVVDASRYQMRRLPIERQMDAAWFRAMMALPEVFSYRTRLRNG